MMSIDQFIIIVSLLGTFFLGIFTSKSVNHINDFVTGSKNFSTPVIVATVFATVIGGGSTYSIISKVYIFGIYYSFAFFGLALNRILVGHFIAPKLSDFPSNIQTIPQIMQLAYGRKGRIFTAIFGLCANAAGTGIQCFAMGKILESYLGIDFFYGALGAATLIVCYSSAGGIRSVIYTDVLQFIIIICAIPIGFILSMNAAGGFTKVLHYANQNDLLQMKIEYFYLFLSFLLGAADPPFLHRLLIAKDFKKVSLSFKISGLLSFLHYSFMGIIGLSAAKLFQGTPNMDPLVGLINSVFPHFFKGLYISAILAAMMSSADSDLNIAGINFGYDILDKASNKTRIIWARISTIIIGYASVFFAFYYDDAVSIIVSTYSFWGPMIMVPLFFLLYGKVVSQKQFYILIVTSFVLQKGWNFLAFYPSFDGLILGMIYAISFMALFSSGKKKNHAQALA